MKLLVDRKYVQKTSAKQAFYTLSVALLWTVLLLFLCFSEYFLRKQMSIQGNQEVNRNATENVSFDSLFLAPVIGSLLTY